MFKLQVTSFQLYTVIVLAAIGLGTPVVAQGEMTLDEVRQGTLLMKAPVPGRYDPAPIQETEARIRVTGPIARAAVKQRFRNPGDAWAEAVYAFPLPEDAAVDQLRMRVGERVIEGRIEEKLAARKAYETAASEGRRAGLVEQRRPNLFTTAVANIPPRGEVEVEIEYQHLLRWRDGAFGLRFPMAITPRYQPGSAGTLEQSVQLSGGWSVLPGEIPNVVEISPPAEADEGRPLNPVTLEVVLNAGFPLGSLESRYHAIDRIDGDEGEVSIRLQHDSVPAERDFELVWRPKAGQAPSAAFFTEQTEAGAYGLLMVMPPANVFEQQGGRAREAIFIVDTSGSMGGASIRQAREALGTALGRLRPQDRFNLIEFNSSSQALHSRPVAASEEHIRHALRFTDGLQAGGGTEMQAALAMAFDMPVQNDGHLQQLIFITDGAAGNERQLMGLIQRRLGSRRLFTVGIGSAPNSHFMTEAAHHGRGSFTYIGDPAEVQEKMEALFAKMEHPALTDLRLDLPEAAEVLPDPLPDLYLGEPVVAAMKLSANPERGLLEGNLGNLLWKSNLSLKRSGQQEGLGVFWARERIRQWMRGLARGDDPAAVRDAVLELALEHHLVSPYTSLVAVDETPVRPLEASHQSHALKHNLPAGWQPSAQPASQGGDRLAMAAGATSFQVWLYAGIGIMLMAGAMLRGRRMETS